MDIITSTPGLLPVSFLDLGLLGLLLFCPGVSVVEILIPDSSDCVLVFHHSDVLGVFALVAASSLVVSRVSDTPRCAQVLFFVS